MSIPSAPPIIPGTSGQATGAAVHKDLYKLSADPQAERARLRGEARTLGLGFFVFFSLIIGGLSLLLNGAHKRGHVVEVAAPAGVEADDAKLVAADAARWTARWSGERTSPIAYVDLADEEKDDVTGEVAMKTARVRVKALDADGRRHEVGSLYAQPVDGAQLLGLETTAGPAQAVRSFPYALRTARLARVIPTHCVIAIGALMGLLGVLVPGLLIPFYKFWMRFVAAPLGWFNTRLILGVVFFILFTPMAIALAIKRAITPDDDPLSRQPKPGRSYWRRRDQPRPKNHFERTF
jgi:hypothetical protein